MAPYPQILTLAKIISRGCVMCGARDTNTGKTGSKMWHRHNGDDGMICHRCYQANRSAKRIREAPIIKPCFTCGATVTKTNKKGEPVWKHDDNQNRLCYWCHLEMLRVKREISGMALRCQSAICVENRRMEGGASPDYKNKAHCVACRSNHAKKLDRCPCCNQRLRHKPKYNRERYLASKLKV